MGEFLGLLAGGGMLLFIGGLLVCFFRRIGFMRDETYSVLKQSAVMTLTVGCGYGLFSALVYQVTYGNLPSVAEAGMIFSGGYMQRMFSSLVTPGGNGFFSGMFSRIGHLLGAMLFGQYLLAGIALAWCMTFSGTWLLLSGIKKMTDKIPASNAVFIILCLPGAVFLFLPGWPPIAFLLLSAVLFFLARPIAANKIKGNASCYGWLLAVSVILSAAVTVGAVQGRLG